MNSRFNWLPILLILVALVSELAIALDAPLEFRAPVVLGFLLIAPGLAFVPLLRIGRAQVELVLAIALSLVLDLLVSEGLVLLGVWSGGSAYAVLVFLTVMGSVLQIFVPRSVEPSALEE